MSARSSRSRQVKLPPAKILGLAVLGLAGLAAAVQARRTSADGWRSRGLDRIDEEPTAQELTSFRAVRSLHAASALLATSTFLDSAVEHYRGSFKNPGMYTPLITSGLTILSGTRSALGIADIGQARRLSYLSAVLVGAAGTGFHIYYVQSRPGGFSWLNLFYSAPLGAPAALSLAGVLGSCASSIDDAFGAHERPTLLGAPAGRLLVAISGLGIVGTASEAALFHFRGAFQNPFMWLPVTVPPLTGALMLKAAIQGPGAGDRSLPLLFGAATIAIGLAGVGFHAYGISRAMGGWGNWTQNVLDGPPLPAPPAFSALALAALASIALMEAEDD